MSFRLFQAGRRGKRSPETGRKFHHGDDHADGGLDRRRHLSRLGDGAWSVAFAEPSTLAGVVLDFSGGEVTASYKGLGFSVPQSAMPAKSVLSQMILVVDELAQQEEITGKEKDGGVAVEGESEGNPYTLTLTESGDLAGFSLENFDAELTFTQFQTGADVATEITTME